MRGIKKLNKTLAMGLAIILSILILPGKISWANEDLDIISKTNVSANDAKKWAKEKNATETFIGLADLYWSYYNEHGGVNPGIAYVQSAIETGFGKFGGVLDESYKNPCGLKNPAGGEDLDPNAHFRFDSWEHGVKAHLDHLALYAGETSYPRSDTYDPRHFPYLLGKAKTVQALSGSWATDKEYGNKIIRNYKQIIEIAKKPSKMWVDKPSNGDILNNELKISGWALNDSGIKEIKAYIDGNFVGTLEYGLSREDIGNVYPEYENSNNSGFEGIIDISKYAKDYYSLRVDVIGNDGNIDSQYVRFDKEIKNESKMWVDKPTNGDILNNELKISGWALNNSGVKEVKAYIDGEFVDTLEYGVSREDIGNVYPEYENSNNSGFEGIVDISKYPKDYYSLRVDVIGNNGNIDSQYVRFDKEIKNESKMWVDKPTNGDILNNELKISGWALNNSGVKEVKAYIDGEFVDTLEYGVSREDIGNVYPEYENSNNSGFEGIVDISKYPKDYYSLRVDVIGNDGTIDSQYIGFNKVNKESKMWVDKPTNGDILNNELKISGWALNDSGIKDVKVYIDGKYTGILEYGFLREDIGSLYPEYKNSKNAGFEGIIDISKYPEDYYSLRVDVTGNDGTIDSQYIRFNKEKKESKMWVENPTDYFKTQGLLDISGWALNDSGIREIKVYVDGKYIKGLTYGIERLDVNNTHPNYLNGKNSGFNGSVDLRNLASGKLNFRIDAVGYDNSVQSRYFTIINNKINIIDAGLEFDFGLEGPSVNNPQKLVLHHAAGNSTVQSVHNYHRFTNKWAGIGYHFYIHKDGKIYKGREEYWRGAHAAEVPGSPGYDDGILENDVNASSLGIAVQGDYMTQNMPKQQEDAVVEVGKYAVEKYGIFDIFKHGDKYIGQTSCPGTKYPFERIKARILSDYIYVYDIDNLE